MTEDEMNLQMTKVTSDGVEKKIFVSDLENEKNVQEPRTVGGLDVKRELVSDNEESEAPKKCCHRVKVTLDMKNENGLQGAQTTEDIDVKEELVAHTKEPEIPRTICGRSTVNGRLRHKLLHTMCTTWAMVSSGMAHTMMGLAFPDLMLIIKQDLAKSSWIFTAWSFGNMLGSLSTGFMYDRLNKLVVLVSLSFGLSLTNAATPWCIHFPAMLFIHLIAGGFSSAIHSTVTADTIFLWKHEKGTYLQIVHLAATAGGILSPFAVKPFLAERHSASALGLNVTNDSMTNLGHNVRTVNSSNDYDRPLSSLVCDERRNDSHNSLPFDNVTLQTYGETKIQYAYLISAVFTFFAVLLYLLVFVTHGNVHVKDCQYRGSPEVRTTVARGMLPNKVTLVFIVIGSVQIMIYVTLQRHLFGLFMTYALNQLNWSKNKSSNTMAAFWCVFCFGRLTAVFTTRKWKEKILNLFYFTVTTISITGFVTASLAKQPVFIIIGLLCSAFGMSPLFTYMFSWFSNYITPVTGKITGVVYVFMAIGSMTVPVLAGHLMKNYSYQWFLYLLIILLALVIFLTMLIRAMYMKIGQKLKPVKYTDS